jgi:uncharacterized membrane protein YdfJ with MMPL/SSD domain
MFYGLAAKIGGIILAIALIFGAGYSTAWKSSQVQIGALKGAIQASNAMSAKVLADSEKKVSAATKQALTLNNELDSARESAISTINSYRDQLAASSLRDPNGYQPCGSNAVPASANTGIGESNATNGTNVSEKLAQLLRSESQRADQCAIDKNLLLRFVKSNCGIQK